MKLNKHKEFLQKGINMKDLFDNGTQDLDLDDISSSLADGVSDCLDNPQAKETDDEFMVNMEGVFEDEILDDSSEELFEMDIDISDVIDEDETVMQEDEENVEVVGKRKKMPKPLKIFLIVLGALAGIALILYLVLYFWIDSRYVHNDFKDEERYEEEFEEVDPEEDDGSEAIKAEDVSWDKLKGDTKYDENVINILLVGCDAVSGSSDRGRTDTIMIATINKNQKSVKLTSICRDTYVPIEGYSDNKINQAYRQGGMSLLKTTVEDVFKIGISYSVRINFDTFQLVIDELGGIEVTLNEKEAAFINEKTVKSADISAGDKVKLNGEQALWFSRIRKITSKVYGHDDLGRTKRQRTVLNYIFQKYKDMSYVELVEMVNTLLPYVETDMTTNEIIGCAWNALSFRNSAIEEYRVPADRCFEIGRVKIPNGKKMDVLLINNFYKENLDGVHMFIYGDTDY